MQSEHGIDGDDSDVCLSSIVEKFKNQTENNTNPDGTIENTGEK